MSYELQECGACGQVHTGPCAYKLIEARCPKCRRFMAGLWSYSVEPVAIRCCHTRYWVRIVEGTAVLTPRKQETSETERNKVILTKTT